MPTAPRSTSVEGFTSVTLVSDDESTAAEFVPDANMLCCSFSYAQHELLHRGDGVRAYADKGRTTGIPLLHPWANRLSRFGYEVAGSRVALPEGDPRIPVDPGGLPIHGVLPRMLRWEQDSASERDRLTATLRWGGELLELFPFAHELRLEARVRHGELSLVTTLTANADDRVPVSFGYHPYTRVPSGSRDEWEVTLGASTHLVLSDRMIPTGEEEPVAERSFPLAGRSLDDAYGELDPNPEFGAAAEEASLNVRFDAGYSFAQVYAPEGEEFICFEPMTAAADALNSGQGLRILNPGEARRAEFTISVSGLS